MPWSQLNVMLTWFFFFCGVIDIKYDTMITRYRRRHKRKAYLTAFGPTYSRKSSCLVRMKTKNMEKLV